MINRLPNLIFFEPHDDSVTNRVIAKLIPQLKELGYGKFFEESPPDRIYSNNLESKCLSEAREELLYNVVEYAAYHMNEFAESNQYLEISKNDCLADKYFDRSKFMQGEFVPTPKFALVLDSVRQQLSDGLNMYFQLAAAHLFLINQIIEHDIIFQGIDDIRCPPGPIHKAFDQFREQTIAAAYAKVEDPVIGRNGLMHVGGIQSELMRRENKAVCAQKYLCFYIYSIATHDDIPDLLEGELKARSGVHDLPLGLISIDGSQHSDDQIMEIILGIIKSKLIFSASDKDTFTLFRDELPSSKLRAYLGKNIIQRRWSDSELDNDSHKNGEYELFRIKN